MLGIEHYITFLTTSIIFTLVPGIDTIFVLNKSLGYGSKAGLLAIAGITTGNMVHVTLSAFGLSLIVARVPELYLAIKYMGAAYMVYLGVMAIRGGLKTLAKLRMEGAQAGADAIIDTSVEMTPRQHYISGVVTNLFNPKVPLFFLAYVPQFVARGHESDPLPFFLLAMTLVILGVLWFIFLAFSAGAVSDRLRKNPRISSWMDLGAGVVFIALAAFMIIT